MGIGALLRDGLALGMLEVFCIRKSVPFERVKTAKHNPTNTPGEANDKQITSFFSGGMDRVKSQSLRVHPTSERGFVCAKVLTTLHFYRNERKRALVVVWAVFQHYFRFQVFSKQKWYPLERWMVQ